MAAEDCSRSFRALEKKTVAKQLRRFVATLFSRQRNTRDEDSRVARVAEDKPNIRFRLNEISIKYIF